MYQRIRDLREDADKNQTEMAGKLNCSQQTYSNYELGLRMIPPEILVHNTSVDYLLGLTNVREPYPRA